MTPTQRRAQYLIRCFSLNSLNSSTRDPVLNTDRSKIINTICYGTDKEIICEIGTNVSNRIIGYLKK